MYKNFYGSIAFFRRLGFGRRLHGLLLLRGLSYVQKCEVAGAAAHALAGSAIISAARAAFFTVRRDNLGSGAGLPRRCVPLEAIFAAVTAMPSL